MKRVVTLLNFIIIGICSFGIIINILHFKEIRYSSKISFDKEYISYKNNIDKVKSNLDKINIYSSNINEPTLIKAIEQLERCYNKLSSSEVLKYKNTKKITIKDINKMYDSYKLNGCQSELQWYYNLEDNKLKRSNMSVNIKNIKLLEEVALFGVEEDIYRVNYYYLYYPFGYVTTNYLIDSLLWDYSDIMYTYKETTNIVLSISNLLLQEARGDSI